MVDFINEVEEELRKDQYNELLRKWGPWIAAAAILIVAAAGIYEYTKSSGERMANATSLSYVEATQLLEEGNRAGASGLFLAISQEADPGYAGLSLMQAGGVAAGNGNRLEAIRLFDQAAVTFDTTLHQDLAALKAAYILMDNADYAAVSSRVTPLAESDRPFEYLARELLGFVALEEGDTQKANAQFAFLARSPDVSDNLKARAEQVLAMISTRANALPEPELVSPDEASAPSLTPSSDQDETE